MEVDPPFLATTTDAPNLVGGTCMACSRRSFPWAATCPWCGASGMDEVLLPRSGTLWAWTAVTAAPPGYEGEVPFGFGVVQLDDDGLRVITRLTEADPAALEFGQPMDLVVVGVAGGEGAGQTWAFTPRERS